MSIPSIAIVGSGYGDEGKGKMTDYYVRQAIANGQNPLVVRYNGGAQAGHCVRTETTTFVHSHYGSGTLAGAPTHLAEEFIVNPILWKQECVLLEDSNVHVPIGTIARDCRVTTPYEMFANLIIENQRGGDRHGSCGVGIFETIIRSQTIKFSAEQMFTYTIDQLIAKFDHIRAHVYNRICQLPLDPDTIWLFDSDNSRQVATAFWRDHIAPMKRWWSLDVPYIDHDLIIFEGAQGLLLSEKHAELPHLTPSDPGVTNCIILCDKYNLAITEVCYVTRAYQTRHGNGALAGECSSEQLGIDTSFETNVVNDSQGNFRYAPLDIEHIVTAIATDYAPLVGSCTKTIAITCTDQVPTGTKAAVIRELIHHCEHVLVSTNPTGDNYSVECLLNNPKGVN